MDNVVNISDFVKKENKQAEEEIPCYESIKNEMMEILKEGKVKFVAGNILEARAIAKMLLELDDDIKYCKFEESMSRKSSFVEIVPVKDDGKEIRFPHKDLSQAYANYLISNNLITETSYGFLPQD